MTSEQIIRLVLLTLHVSFAAMWLGAPLGVPRNIKASFAAGKDAFRLAVADFDRRGGIAAVGGMGVFVTGLVQIFYSLGGFKQAPVQFHIALSLAILAIVNSFAFGAAAKVFKAYLAGTVDGDKVQAQFKRVSMHAHISETLWLGALVMMFIPR